MACWDKPLCTLQPHVFVMQVHLTVYIAVEQLIQFLYKHVLLVIGI